MSKALPLASDLRESHYLAQTGRSDLTPAQARRARHKANNLLRGPAPARLRRRFDRKDRRQVATTGARFVGFIRARIDQNRFAPKPESKRQQRIYRRSGQR